LTTITSLRNIRAVTVEEEAVMKVLRALVPVSVALVALLGIGAAPAGATATSQLNVTENICEHVYGGQLVPRGSASEVFYECENITLMPGQSAFTPAQQLCENQLGGFFVVVDASDYGCLVRNIT
jgi:hypothetical protein